MIRQKKIAIAIVVIYAAFLLPGLYMGYRFLENTKLVYKAPSDSLVARSEVVGHIHFQNQIGFNPMWILVQNTNASESIINNPSFRNYSAVFNASIQEGGRFHKQITFIEGYYFVPNISTFQDKLIGGANNDSTLFNINVADDVNYDNFAVTLQNFNDAWLRENANNSFSMQYTGVDLISKDLESGILGDLAIIDAVSLPLALMALAMCLRSVRLVMIALVTVPCTIALAFSVMFPISHVTTISSFAPEMAAACMLAISIDYALFILSRFVEQCEMQHAKFGESPETQWVIIKNVTVLSAHNILVSGLTIAVALGGLAFLPINFLSTIGLTMSIGAVCAVCVSMTLMPSVLFVGFSWFSISYECLLLARWYNKWRRGVDSNDKDALHNSSQTERQGLLPDADSSPRSSPDATLDTFRRVPSVHMSPRDAITDYHMAQYEEQMNSLWFKIGSFAFWHPIITVLAVLALGAPFFYFATQLKVDFDLFNQVPRSSEHAKTLKQIVATIGQGSAAPYYIVFAANNASTTIWFNPEFGWLINNVTIAFCALSGQPLDRVLSPFMLPPSEATGPNVTWLTNEESQAMYALSSDYRFVFDKTVSADRSAVLLSLYTTFDPFDFHSDDYLTSMKNVIDAYQGPNDWVFIGMLGAASDSWSIMHHAMDLFPYQVGITFGVIFIFIGAVFRSVFVPFRMVFTVAYTIGMAYGAGVIMFQYSWLHPVWPALDGVQAYTWTVPIFSFSLLCALALDYDVFLLTRIIEFKQMGYCDEAAISKAVWKTGHIISFAGAIMFISFGSMVFSNTTMLNEFGAITAFAVAVDTFVIRPFFAPALMSIFPKHAWWPKKFPNLERTVEDMRGDLLDHSSSRNAVSGSWTQGGAPYKAKYDSLVA